MKSWRVEELGACYGDLLAEARKGMPQFLVQDGREAFVLLSAEEYRSLEGMDGDAGPGGPWDPGHAGRVRDLWEADGYPSNP